MAEFDAKHLGMILRRRRKALNLNQSALAHTSGVPEIRLSRIERGKGQDVTFREVCALMPALRLTLEDAAYAAGVGEFYGDWRADG